MPAKGTVDEIKAYFKKGDVLHAAKYTNLPAEADGFVVNGPLYIEGGEPAAVIVQNSSEHA